MAERMFPISGAPNIPWAVIEPCERQAQKNHGQSIAELASRGGLSACEAVAVLNGRDWRPMRDSEALRELLAIVKERQSNPRAEAAEAKLQAAQAEAAELRKALVNIKAQVWYPAGPWEITPGPGGVAYINQQIDAALSTSTAPALAVIEAALEVKPHIDAWRNALTIAKVRAQEKGDDEAIAYWAHEERAGLRDGGALVAACDAYTKHTEGAG